MKGILLIQLGTPDAPDTKSVRRYLAEFLADPDVIDIPALFRYLLLYGIILPFRPQKSAAAYQKIWTPQGSPLYVFTQELKARVQEQLGDSFVVELGMRYGNPSIEAALKRLASKGVSDYLIAPLYPQYAMSSTLSSLKKTVKILEKMGIAECRVLAPFYNEPSYIQASLAAAGRSATEIKSFDHILFSYHGLPVRQVQKMDDTQTHCLQVKNCCEQASIAHSTCYRHQCFENSKLLAQLLGLSPSQWSVSFQSRLGRAEWLPPSTEDVLTQLPQKSVKKLGVFCPSFVADCLETLEEIRIRGRELFIQSGGHELQAFDCLNAHPAWVQALSGLCRNAFLKPPQELAKHLK